MTTPKLNEYAAADNTRQFAHAVLPQMTADEMARQQFVGSLKLHIATRIAPGNKDVYESAVVPDYQNKHGRPPENRHQVRKEMKRQGYYQMWSALLRSSQEMMWKSCQLSVERQLPELIQAAGTSTSKYSTLELDPDLEIPNYLSAVDNHCQPGSYHTENMADDVAAGAIYDCAVYLYFMGRLGPFNDDFGASTVAYVKRKEPDFKPQRILEMGCTVGHSTIPYVEAYPDAEVHAIDVAAPVLRYAHARAESLGKSIHFSQQNAEKTNFEDASFDLIVSHVLVHETSTKAFRNIMKECHRLLKPGGWVVHCETPPYKDMEPYDAFILDWDTYNNNEPFWSASHEIDPAAVAGEFGFKEDSVFEALAPSVAEVAEAKRTGLFQGGDFGGSGMWYLYGMQK